MFTKLGRDEALMSPHVCLGFSPDLTWVDPRWGQKQVKEDFKEILLQTGRLYL